MTPHRRGPGAPDDAGAVPFRSAIILRKSINVILRMSPTGSLGKTRRAHINCSLRVLLRPHPARAKMSVSARACPHADPCACSDASLSDAAVHNLTAVLVPHPVGAPAPRASPATHAFAATQPPPSPHSVALRLCFTHAHLGTVFTNLSAALAALIALVAWAVNMVRARSPPRPAPPAAYTFRT